jgi:FdrA protein
VLLVSKPPAPSVQASVEAAAAELSVPVRSAVLSPETPDLTAAVEALLTDMGMDVPTWPSRPGPAESAVPGATLKGLYSGGTLADEAMLIAAPALGDIRSNTPLKPELDLGTDLSASGHVVIDFGDDALTVGRAHPMIDPTLRLEAIADLAASDEPAVLLLDVVLGYGADADPAGALVPALTAARAKRNLPVVVALVGTEGDPQGWSRQADALAAAGASVFASNAAATRHALRMLGVAP